MRYLYFVLFALFAEVIARPYRVIMGKYPVWYIRYSQSM